DVMSYRFFFSSRRRHTSWPRDWSSDVCSSDLNNSVFSARTFFQAGDVQPARQNEYGFALAAPLWKGGYLSLEGSQQKIRGSVNRSEERRVGKEGISRCATYHYKKNNKESASAE